MLTDTVLDAGFHLPGAIMDARRIFSRGGQIRRLRTKVPQWGPRDGAPVEVWGRSLQKPTTGCENNASIIRLLGVLQCTKHFTTFPEGSKCPLLPIPAGTHEGYAPYWLMRSGNKRNWKKIELNTPPRFCPWVHRFATPPVTDFLKDASAAKFEMFQHSFVSYAAFYVWALPARLTMSSSSVEV